jgi:hypothetical protein
MMVPKKSLILAGAALALFGASASAQSQASGKVFSRYNKPLKSVSLDLATGTISRGPAVNNRSATTTVDFNNNDLGGFVGVDTGNGFCEWFDAAVKGFAGNGSDLMNNIVFAYCSAMLAPGSGGPGGSVKLGFYEGYTWFGGAPTTTVAAFTLTGLPANTGSSSFFGGFRCFFIQVIFTNMVAFADGPIGYSWKFLDVGTTGVLGGTWPFLSCVVSCSGAITQVDGQGMTDILDEYCPPGFRKATFTFGTTSGSFTSMSMDVREVTDFAATEVGYNATTSPNGDTLSTAEGKAVVGSTWTATLARSPVTGAGTFNTKVRTTRIALPNGVTPPAPVQGRLLISGPVLASINGTHNGTTGSAPSAAIPLQFSFVCFHYVAQATATGGGVKLTSALDGTTGTN